MAGQAVYSAVGAKVSSRDRYYGFLECRDTPVAFPEPVASEGWPTGFRWTGPTATRLQFSAVPAAKFLELSPGIGGPPARPNNAWRARRRDQLLELFAKLPVYRIEIYTPTDAPQGLQTAFRLGGWFRLDISSTISLVDPAAGLLSRLGEDTITATSLARLRRVSPEFRDRLRRVFSLDHLGDLGSDEPGGGGEPTPTSPIAPPLIHPAPDRPKQYAVTVFGTERLKGHDRDKVRQTPKSLVPQPSVKARPRVRLRISGPS